LPRFYKDTNFAANRIVVIMKNLCGFYRFNVVREWWKRWRQWV